MGQITVDLSSKLEVLQQETHAKKTGAGVAFPRHFTARLEPGKTPYDEVHGKLEPPPLATTKAR